MSVVITDLNIEAYRGIRNLALSDFNHVNVLTGRNDSGKTSILELIATLRDPLRADVWLSASYGAHFGGTSVFTELIRLFPYDDEKKVVQYAYPDAEGKQHHVRLDASVNDSMITPKELTQLNGYVRTNSYGSYSDDELQPSKILEIEGQFDEERSKFSFYELQTQIRAASNKVRIPVVVRRAGNG